MRIPSVVATAALLLSGCDHGVSVSAESVGTNGYKGENSISGTETQSVSKSNKETIKVPVLTELQQGADDYALTVGPDGGMLVVDSPKWLQPVIDLAHRATAGDITAAKSIIVHTKAIYQFRKAMQPSNGWPSSERESKYIYRKTMELTFADLFANAIAQNLPDRFLGPDDIDSSFIAAVYAITPQQLDLMQQRADLRARLDGAEHIVVDGVSGKGTTWTAGISTYEGQNGGWIVRRAGVVEFGDSRIGGVTREVELADASSLDSKIESGHRLGDHAGQDEVTRGTATAK